MSNKKFRRPVTVVRFEDLDVSRVGFDPVQKNKHNGQQNNIFYKGKDGTEFQLMVQVSANEGQEDMAFVSEVKDFSKKDTPTESAPDDTQATQKARMTLAHNLTAPNHLAKDEQLKKHLAEQAIAMKFAPRPNGKAATADQLIQFGFIGGVVSPPTEKKDQPGEYWDPKVMSKVYPATKSQTTPYIQGVKVLNKDGIPLQNLPEDDPMFHLTLKEMAQYKWKRAQYLLANVYHNDKNRGIAKYLRLIQLGDPKPQSDEPELIPDPVQEVLGKRTHPTEHAPAATPTTTTTNKKSKKN
jgi:hypothetical protein